MAANQSTRLKTDIGSLDFLTNPTTLATFEEAAKSFIKHDDGTVKIWAASRDWFMEEWGRDTFISLPGLLLSTGRFEEARQVFLHYAKYEQGGLIPNIVRNGELSFNTVDASLWFIHALKAYVEATQDWALIEELLPTVRNIISGYSLGTEYTRNGQQYSIAMDKSDGLIVAPAQTTWMDADPSGNGSQAVTPRNGKAVEINALWYRALLFLITIEKHFNGDTTELEAHAELVRTSFIHKFWNHENNSLYDVIEGDPHSGAIRPNQIIVVSHGEDLLTAQQQQQVLATVERELLTVGGLRTLSPKDSNYIGHYDTSAPVEVKDLAYHQGTIWPWLIGSYCDALRIVKAQQGEPIEIVNNEVKKMIAPLVTFCLESEFKSLPEIFSADEPFEPGGTTSQAWSVAEVLRILKSI